MIVLNPYKKASNGARQLRKALRAKGVEAFINHLQPSNPNVLVVNWGNSDWGYDPRSRKVINDPTLLKSMTNKLKFFRTVGHDRMVPEWTDKAVEAGSLGEKVLARQRLEASGGDGIVIWEPLKENTPPPAPLYVKYENKTHEYRVHMARGWHGRDFHPLLIQRKIFKRSPGIEVPRSWEIRNHDNGFIYVRNSDYPTPDCVPELAALFMRKHFSGLHFAALDVIFHEKKNRAWILEGNTAPGLEGNTIDVYADYLKLMDKEAA